MDEPESGSAPEPESPSGVGSGADDPLDAADLRVLSRDELEAAVRRRTAELQDVMDTMADVLVRLDPEGRVEMANAAVADVLGYDPDDLQGRPVSFLLATGRGDDGDATAASYSGAKLVERLLDGGEVRDLEIPFETADGRAVPMQVSASVMREGDAVDGYVCVATDVTERKRRERELERSRDRYRTLFENNQVVLLEFDLSAVKERVDALAEETDDVADYLDDRPAEHERVLAGMDVLDANQRAVSFYEAESVTELAENVDRTTTEAALDTLKRLWRAVADGETDFRSECKVQTLDGEVRDVLLDVNVPEAHADDYGRVYVSAVDITDRKERERKLRRKNELLDQFASVVSHDVATPLSIIGNKARLVQATGDPSHAEDIFEATRRVQELVDELHDLARQGEEVGETAPVALDAVVSEAWQSVESLGASLTVETSRTVQADRDRLRQLLANLLRNAVEHGSTNSDTQARRDTSPENADAVTASETVVTDTVSVTVGGFEDGFYVADDGPGIPDEERDRVFEQGFSTDDDGTGIGLAIVRRIADGHGWTVEVSESEAGGARFEVYTDE